MKNKTYVIRVTTEKNIYEDYIVDAANIFFAKIIARNAFLKEYPDANTNLKLTLESKATKKICEAKNIIKEAN